MPYYQTQLCHYTTLAMITIPILRVGSIISNRRYKQNTYNIFNVM